jgi:hypothetical protein
MQPLAFFIAQERATIKRQKEKCRAHLFARKAECQRGELGKRGSFQDIRELHRERDKCVHFKMWHEGDALW